MPDILTARRAELEQVAQYLLEHETMESADFEAVFAGGAPEGLPGDGAEPPEKEES